MQITVIEPIVREDVTDANPLPSIDGVQLRKLGVRWGVQSIESRLDDELAAPAVIDAAITAERSGADAIVVNCMDDPGVGPAREMVRVPVVGPAEASVHLALQLGRSFGIITTSHEDVPVVLELVDRLQLADRCGSVRALGLPVLELESDPEQTFRRYLDAATEAVVIDGCSVLIAGCTLLSKLSHRLTAELAERSIEVPVIDPMRAAIEHAVTLVRLGISHSPHAYPSPGPQTVSWPDGSAQLGGTVTAGSPR
jgi:allantoin racemase